MPSRADLIYPLSTERRRAGFYSAKAPVHILKPGRVLEKCQTGYFQGI